MVEIKCTSGRVFEIPENGKEFKTKHAISLIHLEHNVGFTDDLTQKVAFLSGGGDFYEYLTDMLEIDLTLGEWLFEPFAALFDAIKDVESVTIGGHTYSRDIVLFDKISADGGNSLLHIFAELHENSDPENVEKSVFENYILRFSEIMATALLGLSFTEITNETLKKQVEIVDNMPAYEMFAFASFFLTQSEATGIFRAFSAISDLMQNDKELSVNPQNLNFEALKSFNERSERAKNAISGKNYMNMSALEKEAEFIKDYPNYKFGDLAKIPYSLYYSTRYLARKNYEVELNMMQYPK